MSGRIRRNEAGAVAVEFALITPLLLTFIGGLFAIGLHVAYAGLADNAAREGLRKATIRQSGVGYGDQAAVLAAINDKKPGFLPDALPADVTCTVGTSTAPCPVEKRNRQGDTVTVTVTFRLPGVTSALRLVPFVGGGLSDISEVTRSAKGRRE